MSRLWLGPHPDQLYALIVLESPIRQLDPLYDLFCPRRNILAKENFVGPNWMAISSYYDKS